MTQTKLRRSMQMHLVIFLYARSSALKISDNCGYKNSRKSHSVLKWNISNLSMPFASFSREKYTREPIIHGQYCNSFTYAFTCSKAHIILPRHRLKRVSILWSRRFYLNRIYLLNVKIDTNWHMNFCIIYVRLWFTIITHRNADFHFETFIYRHSFKLSYHLLMEDGINILDYFTILNSWKNFIIVNTFFFFGKMNAAWYQNYRMSLNF